jgi:hypothetical protein
MLEISGTQIDTAWLEEQVAERRLQVEWQAAKRFKE